MNRLIKSHLKTNFTRVFVKGEVSGVSLSKGGHLYFSLKDEQSSIRCVAFYRVRKRLKFNLEDGMQVLIIGQIDVYAERGEYEIVVNSITEDGLGQLYVALEQLKKKLSREGLFNPEFKKPLPKTPGKIGVVTSPRGEAIKDIIKTIRHEPYSCEILVFPSLVQGRESVNDITRQIKFADSFNLDCLIVGRGGGSKEDLWYFNSEEIARAVFNCRTPVISAVGHQTDETLIDYVADIRASTPTDAANKIISRFIETENKIIQFNSRLINISNAKLSENKNRLDVILSKAIFNRASIVYESQKTDFQKALDRFESSSLGLINNRRHSLNKIKSEYVIRRPCKMQLDSSKSNLQDLKTRLIDVMNKLLKSNRLNLDKTTSNFNFLADKLVASKSHDLEKAKNSYSIINPCQKQLDASKNELYLNNDKAIREMNLKIENNKRDLGFVRDKPIFKTPHLVYMDKSRQFSLMVNRFQHKSNELVMTNSHELDSMKNSSALRNPERVISDKRYELNKVSDKFISKSNEIVLNGTYRLDSIRKSHIIRNSLKEYRINSNNQLISLNRRLEGSFNAVINENKKDLNIVLANGIFKNPEMIYESKSDEFMKLKMSKVIENPYMILDPYGQELEVCREKLDKINQVIDLKRQQQKQKATYRMIIAAIVILMIIVLFVIFGGI